MKVDLVYFKRSGKVYSSGEYETTKEHLFEIFHEVAEKRARGDLPGLAAGASEFVVLVRVPDHPHDHPALVGVEY